MKSCTKPPISDHRAGLAGTHPIRGIARISSRTKDIDCSWTRLEVDGIEFIFNERSDEASVESGLLSVGTIVEFEANPSRVEGRIVCLNYLWIVSARTTSPLGVEWAIDRWMPDGKALSGGIVLELPRGVEPYWRASVTAKDGSLCFEPIY